MTEKPFKPDDCFTISELSEQLDISPSAIRFYEEKGLISPARSAGNQRIYSRNDRGRLKLIIRGKRFGASLDEIHEMIGPAGIDIDEKKQIERSLYYIERAREAIKLRMSEIEIFDSDLKALKKKLTERMNRIKGSHNSYN